MNISLHRPGSNQNGSSHNAASKLYGRLASFGNFVEKVRDKKEALYSSQSSFSSFASEDLDDIHHDCKQGKIHQTMEHGDQLILGIGRPVDIDTEANDADVTCYHASTPPGCEPSSLMYAAETNKAYCISEDSIKPKRGMVGRSKSFDPDRETMPQVTEPPKRSLGPRSISFSARGASKKSQHVAPVSSKNTDQSTHLSDFLERSESSTQQLRRSMKKSLSFRERKGEGEKQKRRMSESAAAKHFDEDDKVGLQLGQESSPRPSVLRSIPDVNLGSISESNLGKTFETSRRDTRHGLLKKSVSFHGCKSPKPADHENKEGTPLGLSASSKKNKLFQGELFEVGASCAISKEKKEGSMSHAFVIGKNTEKELENAMYSTLHLDGISGLTSRSLEAERLTITRSKSGSENDLKARGAEELSRGIGRVKSFSTTGLKKRDMAEEPSRGVGLVKSNSTECREKKNRSKGKSKLSSGLDHNHNSSKGKSKLLSSSSDHTRNKRSLSPRKTRCSPLERSSSSDQNCNKRSLSPRRTRCSALERSDDLRQRRRLSTGSVTLLLAVDNLYSKTPVCTSGSDQNNTYQTRSSISSRKQRSEHHLRQGRRLSTGSNAQLKPAVLGPKQHDSSSIVESKSLFAESVFDDDSGVDLFRYVTRVPPQTTDAYSYNAFLQLDWSTISGSVCV